MRRNTSSDAGDSAEQSDENRGGFEAVEDIASEALKHDHPGKSCDVTVRAHIRDHDATRDVTDHLIRTDEEWIAVRTWTEAGGEGGFTVKDHGKTLQLEAADLDHDIIADRIRSEALDAIDSHEAVGRPVKPFTALVRNVDAITDHLVARWQEAAEHVVGEQLHDGFAGWTGDTAWTAHVDEALYIEADRATTWFIDEHAPCIVSDDVEVTIHDIYVQALYAAIAEHRDRWNPHLEYAAEVTLKD